MDNLNIRKKVEDMSCLFCTEESVHHLFFKKKCVVEKQMWELLSEIFDRKLGNDFLSIGQLWLSHI